MNDLRQRLSDFLDTSRVQNTIIGVILFNALLLGLETSGSIMAAAGGLILTLDKLCLAIFVVELAAKMFARGPVRFFGNMWNVFDFVLVGISLVPGSETFSVLRALRVLRVLRVISIAPRLQRVVEGFISALPGMGSVFLLISIIFYIGAVMATKLFAESFPDRFGTLGGSAFTLFQVMTLEGWSDGVVRPVMEVYPFAWAFFLPFIMITTFAVVNLLVGLIVNSMQAAHEADEVAQTDAYRREVLARLEAIERRLDGK